MVKSKYQEVLDLGDKLNVQNEHQQMHKHNYVSTECQI